MPSEHQQSEVNSQIPEKDIIQCLPIGFDIEKIVDLKQSSTGYETYKVQLSKYVWIRKDLVADRHALLEDYINKRLKDTLNEEIEIVHDDTANHKSVKNNWKNSVKKTYSTRNSLKRNGSASLPNSEDLLKIRRRTKDIVCNVCHTVFLYDAEFEEHIRQIHDGINVNLQCQICQKLLKDKNALKAHLVIHSDDAPFECSFCSKRFKLRKRVNEHIKTHHGTYECTTCHTRFEKLNEFKAHAAREHPTKTPRLQSNFFACTECDNVFLNRSTLMAHIRTHAELRSFQCKQCSKRFKHQQHLSAHMRVACGKKENLTCKVCGKKFGNESDYAMHVRTHDGTNPLYCAPCDKYFLKSSLFLVHKATHAARKAKAKPRTTYHCSQCDKVFLDKRNFNLHERVHYGKNPYKCAVCDHFFLKKSHLEKHNAWFHSKFARYSCSICGKAFRLRSLLLKHELKHDLEKENSRQFYCISCDLRFLTQRDLSAHLKQSIECFSVECQLCNKIFSTEKLLQRHKAIAHDISYTCKKCEKSFSSHAELRKHQLIHQNQQWNCNDSVSVVEHKQAETENSCSICNRRFQRKAKLLEHVKSVHQKIKDFPCPTCGREFARRYDLKKHMDIHIRDDAAGNLECLICQQKGFTEESLEMHQYAHMRVQNSFGFLNEDQLVQMNKALCDVTQQKDQEIGIDDVSLSRDSNLFISPAENTLDFAEVITPREIEKTAEENKDCAVLVDALAGDRSTSQFQINGKEMGGNIKLQFRDNGHIITIAEVIASNENGAVEVLATYEDAPDGENTSQTEADTSGQQIIYHNTQDQAQIEYLSQIAAMQSGYTQQVAINENTVEVFQIPENQQVDDTVEQDVQGLVIAAAPEENPDPRQIHQQEQYLQNVESLLLHASTLSNN